MTRDEAMSRLKNHERELRQLGVERLFMFGSTSRDCATLSSDVDLFFDYQKGKLSLFDLMEVKDRAAAILGRPVDILTRDSIHRVLRSRIEQSALLVF